ncbi:MAG: CHRD domain-containing protein [Phycisphaerales bacterium]
MFYRSIFATIATGALASAASAGFAGSTVTLNFPLSGSQQVPSVMSNSFGTGSVVYEAASGLFDIDIFIQGIVLGDLLGVGPNSTSIHIHDAIAGENSGIVFDLGLLSSFAVDADGIRFFAYNVPIGVYEDQLLNAGLYVNIHTNDFAGGEIRGQIIPTPGAAALFGLGGLAVVRRRR